MSPAARSSPRGHRQPLDGDEDLVDPRPTLAADPLERTDHLRQPGIGIVAEPDDLGDVGEEPERVGRVDGTVEEQVAPGRDHGVDELLVGKAEPARPLAHREPSTDDGGRVAARAPGAARCRGRRWEIATLALDR